MKYLRAKFENYIGFYNGMGLNVVDIDFTKCKNKIVLIIGMNGCGKSTFMSHLNVFPDGSNDFIPQKDGIKDLVIANESDIYKIHIISEADGDKRKTTKAYINKNGVELNENGNISSYKDIIFTEFELDSNYMSLTRLSSEDKGLADKTPAERKKFTSNIIENLDIYNNMYKTLNKKSLIYKSHLNTIHTKIQNIGDRENLESMLFSLRNQRDNINKSILEANNAIVAIQVKNSIDPEEVSNINNLNNELVKAKANVDSIQVELDMFKHKTHIDSKELSGIIKKNTELRSKYKEDISSIDTNWKNKSSRLSVVNSDIQSLESEIRSSSLDSSIESRYTKSKEDIDNMIKEIESYNVSLDTDYHDLERLLNFYNILIPSVEYIYDNLTPEEVKELVSISDNQNIVNDIMSGIDTMNKDMEYKKNELSKLLGIETSISVLKDRPKKCNINTCPFISDAIKLKDEYKDINKQISGLKKEISILQSSILEKQEYLTRVSSYMPKITKLRALRNSISEILNIISQFDPILLDLEKLVSESNPFNDQRNPTRIVNLCNLLKLYSSNKTNFDILQVEYNAYLDKAKLVDKNRERLQSLINEKNSLITEVSDLKLKLDEYNKTLSELESSISIQEQYNDKYIQFCDIESQYKDIQKRIDEYTAKSNKALLSLNDIERYKADIDNLNRELDPVNNQINTLSGQLTLLESYYEEYNKYKSSYDMIETIKKYCSPTGGGIQTIFMQLYMSKTLELSNQVLSMLFGGEYQLLNFIINENEFRIPFIGNGLPVDDISSGSDSQKAIMGMIINLVLLHQASTKFNIARLDEIDGTLDIRNKAEFVNALYHSIDILEIDQLFLISHSIETDNTNADIIKFKFYNDYESGIESGNVIYDYNQIIG